MFGWCDSDLDQAVGATVIAVYEVDDQNFHLVTDHGKFYFEAEGDCCSHSYFINIRDLNELVGRKLVSIATRAEDRKDPTWDSRGDTKTSYYGADFWYEGGSVYLEMRNESNGYYGGWCNVSRVSA